MKRIFLIIAAALFLCPAEVDAQVISYSQTKITKIKKEREKKVREKREKKPHNGYFQQSADLEIGGFTENVVDFNIGLNYIAGYRFSNLLYLGAGIGVGYTTGLYQVESNYCELGDFQARLFVNTKLYFTKTRLQPFLDLSIGGIYLDEYEFAQSGNDHHTEYYDFGTMINPQIGANYRLNEKVNLYISFGVQFIQPYNASHYPQLKLGVTF